MGHHRRNKCALLRRRGAGAGHGDGKKPRSEKCNKEMTERSNGEEKGVVRRMSTEERDAAQSVTHLDVLASVAASDTTAEAGPTPHHQHGGKGCTRRATRSRSLISRASLHWGKTRAWAGCCNVHSALKALSTCASRACFGPVLGPVYKDSACFGLCTFNSGNRDYREPRLMSTRTRTLQEEIGRKSKDGRGKISKALGCCSAIRAGPWSAVDSPPLSWSQVRWAQKKGWPCS